MKNLGKSFVRDAGILSLLICCPFLAATGQISTESGPEPDQHRITGYPEGAACSECHCIEPEEADPFFEAFWDFGAGNQPVLGMEVTAPTGSNWETPDVFGHTRYLPDDDSRVLYQNATNSGVGIDIGAYYNLDPELSDEALFPAFYDPGPAGEAGIVNSQGRLVFLTWGLFTSMHDLKDAVGTINMCNTNWDSWDAVELEIRFDKNLLESPASPPESGWSESETLERALVTNPPNLKFHTQVTAPGTNLIRLRISKDDLGEGCNALYEYFASSAVWIPLSVKHRNCDNIEYQYRLKLMDGDDVYQSTDMSSIESFEVGSSDDPSYKSLYEVKGDRCEKLTYKYRIENEGKGGVIGLSLVDELRLQCGEIERLRPLGIELGNRRVQFQPGFRNCTSPDAVDCKTGRFDIPFCCDDDDPLKEFEVLEQLHCQWHAWHLSRWEGRTGASEICPDEISDGAAPEEVSGFREVPKPVTRLDEWEAYSEKFFFDPDGQKKGPEYSVSFFRGSKNSFTLQVSGNKADSRGGGRHIMLMPGEAAVVYVEATARKPYLEYCDDTVIIAPAESWFRREGLSYTTLSVQDETVLGELSRDSCCYCDTLQPNGNPPVSVEASLVDSRKGSIRKSTTTLPPGLGEVVFLSGSLKLYSAAGVSLPTGDAVVEQQAGVLKVTVPGRIYANVRKMEIMVKQKGKPASSPTKVVFQF